MQGIPQNCLLIEGLLASVDDAVELHVHVQVRHTGRVLLTPLGRLNR